MDSTFSKEVKEIIAQSREIALDLGYDYITTLHLFLADCKLNQTGTIRKFAFESEEGFQTFYNNQRLGAPITTDGDLHLTVEAEKTIRKAFKLWSHSNYFDTEIRPYHLFIAASLIPNTYFCSIFPEELELYEKLEQYYIQIGQVDKEKVYITLMMRLDRNIRKWLTKRKQLHSAI